MLDNNISTMKPNLVGELNLILLNIPENLSPLERAWLIYNKAGHVFRYDYRIANNIELAHKEIDFLTNNIDYFQTCTQISYLLNLMLNNIEGLESRVIKRNIQLRGNFCNKVDHVAVELKDKASGKEYLLDLTLDLYEIQSGMMCEHFACSEYANIIHTNTDKKYDLLSVQERKKLDNKTKINSSGIYTNNQIDECKKKVIEKYTTDFDTDIFEYGIEQIRQIISSHTFKGHQEGSLFIKRLFHEILSRVGINYKEFNLIYLNNDQIVTLFYFDNSLDGTFLLYSTDNGIIETNKENIKNMLSYGWSTRSNSLDDLLNNKSII